MKFVFTRRFVKDYHTLPRMIQKSVDKQLKLFGESPRHPSLNVKKMRDPRNIWEARITKGYRMTFQKDATTCILRRVGTHDMLRKP